MTEDTGGHIAYVLGAARAQAGRGDVTSVSIVTRAFSDPRLDPVHAQEVEEMGPRCRILRLRTDDMRYLAKEAFEAELPALTQAFLNLLRDGDLPDVIHAHFADAAVLARAASKEFGIPWVYSSHSLALDKCRAQGGNPDPAMSRRIDREAAAIREAGAIIASSRDEAECQIPAYDAASEGRVHRIGPGITAPHLRDTGPAQRLIAPFLRDPSKPILLAVARPIRKKNLAALLRAYAGDPGLQDRANLVVVAGLREGLQGGCPDQDGIVTELFDLVDRHDLWGKVALPRRHDHDEVASLYALAAQGGVFVNPALHEPFGLTLIEAAQSDAPVVATCRGGAADIVASLNCGELVEPTDPRAIAAAVTRLLDDPETPRKAQEAGRIARRIYSWDRWADAAQRVYAGLRVAAPAIHRPHAMLASDIDGTLTGCRDGAAEFTEWARTRDPGMVLAVATGRSVVEARRVLREWHLPMPDLFITSVGSEIWRWGRDGALRPCGDYAAMIGGDWDRDGVRAALAPLGLTAQPGHDQRAFKLSFFGNVHDRDRIGTALKRAGLRARVILSHDRLIDVLPRNAGKAAAIRFEAARMGIPADSCIVAGDSGNDLDMLQGFASAIIPANASPEVASVRGAWRSEHPHAAGVLDGLDRFGHGPGILMAAE
ncbi:HAD-IIB family hydrolase [Paracoccus sp. C2R09]|nr:HAD-IIB family hydrolase [Paracoccus sp. C2R09]